VRRLLIVGTDVPNFPSVSWSEWESANPLDFQGLVLDCRRPERLPSEISINHVLMTLANNGHTAYVILPDASALGPGKGSVSWIPDFKLLMSPGSGRTLNVKSNDSLFENYKTVLAEYEMYFQLVPNVHQVWVAGVVDNVSRVICAKTRTIYLLHPPPQKLEQKALKIIIENFKPEPFPISSVSKPSWVDQAASQLPGVADVQAALTVVRGEIKQKHEQLRAEEDKLLQLCGWADLLWLEGLQLQEKVNAALNLISVASSSSSASGHTCDLSADESGTHFVFEVTGSSRTIGIEKGRQLMQWVTDAVDPNSAKGVLIANAFRNEPPEKRPPSPDHKVFVHELEKFAEKYHLALLDVRELYRIVCLKLTGKTIEKSTVLNALLADGVVRFPIT
jgi:hypothetical protein